MAESPPPPTWQTRSERGSAALLRFMARLSRRFGRRWTRPVLWLIAAYFTLAAAPARRASRSYLTRVLGRAAGWRDIHRHVLTFATTIQDRLFLLGDRLDLIDVSVTGHQPLLDLCRARAQGVFLFGAHIGSFEAMRAAARSGVPFRVVSAMYPDNAQRINATLAAINPNVVLDIIALGRPTSMLQLSERLSAGDCVGVLADRAGGRDGLRMHRFLGAPAAFPSGPFRLALALKTPIYLMSGLYLGGNRYAVELEPLWDGLAPPRAERDALVDALQARYVEWLERQCHRAPYNWFNFFDVWEPSHAQDVHRMDEAAPQQTR